MYNISKNKPTARAVNEHDLVIKVKVSMSQSGASAGGFFFGFFSGGGFPSCPTQPADDLIGFTLG